MFAEANIYSVANPTTMRVHLSTTDLIVLVIASIHRKVVLSITYTFSVTERPQNLQFVYYLLLTALTENNLWIQD